MSSGPEPSAGVSRDEGRRAAGNGFVADTLVSLKRWLVKTSRSPFVTFSSLVQPVVLFVLMASVFGAVAEGALADAYGDGVHYVAFLTPAIVIQSALAAAAVSGIGLVKDMETGMFDKTLVSPIDRGAMLLGKVLSELLRVAVQTVVILVLGALMLRSSGGAAGSAYLATGLAGIVGIIGITVLFSLVFVAFSNIVALVTRDEEATIMIANLLTFPLLFCSSAFLPLTVLPDWIRTVAVVNPVTYGVDGVRALVLGADVTTVVDVTAFGGLWNTVAPAAAVLALFALVLGAIAGKLLESAWKAEVR
ncbi:ABC transporter permease [Natrinema sp. SYSU A 869]|uniref:ABC transporter permease n=1 Tax=Natrinema sp. SYSU A 869 TaxID=2871694 RepID=UPI001CA3F5E8|nr:ABC transporter permease [Natrinema sp. SYSU A 869]